VCIHAACLCLHARISVCRRLCKLYAMCLRICVHVPNALSIECVCLHVRMLKSTWFDGPSVCVCVCICVYLCPCQSVCVCVCECMCMHACVSCLNSRQRLAQAAQKLLPLLWGHNVLGLVVLLKPPIALQFLSHKP
jgi:hypothetical protein